PEAGQKRHNRKRDLHIKEARALRRCDIVVGHTETYRLGRRVATQKNKRPRLVPRPLASKKFVLGSGRFPPATCAEAKESETQKRERAGGRDRGGAGESLDAVVVVDITNDAPFTVRAG